MKLDFVEIAITSECNLLCKHCYQKDDKDHEYKLPLDVVTRVMADAKSCGANKVQFTGGEFFTHPNFEEILDLANNLNFSINISTNGTLLSDNHIILLRSIKNLDTIFISIDGFDEDHDWMRGTGTFNKTIQIVKKLINSDIHVGIIVTMNKRNVFYLEELILYLGSIGVENISLLNIGAAGFALENAQHLLPSKNGLKIIRNFYRKYGEINSSEKCKIFSNVLSINYDGTIYPCTMAKSTRTFPLGSVYDNSLIDIWNTIFMENKYSFINFKRGELKECVTCDFFQECEGRCRIRAYKYSGNFFAPDPFACWIYKEMEAENVQKLMFGAR
ncbi:radical SAM protein [Methanosarcina sp. Z-7115]|uniref:Radical SAM protein n=1 Tax=Methanosarcina baikalica TaxID=3073890 RepID=A0ABU2D4E1_9EURY|nr:radical SAM protein [Methanosarcina sp. Z-7115]MDR7666853.1 radical SAM protein [Methanosarcina sp. Z-7115]